MQKFILFLTMCFIALGAMGQESTTDYIYSNNGFVMKTVKHPDFNNYGAINNNYEHISMGLYSADGKVLVSASTHNCSYCFVVAYGTEVIASRAFQYLNSGYIVIPSTVKYIAPDALLVARTDGASNRIVAIYDDAEEVSDSGIKAPSADPNATEVARYNVQGIRLNDPQNGINIIQMSDGTAKKELVTE